ncbi:transcriptional regulator [Scopulibacillus darangshiensis]|uniref:Transcriptional regulator n=1 Tax=Scopulibacillus darangshiensis TaxID=442528 RepID=A0A4R2P7R0_9BACL|nr:helix-turn-helix domain-containing protein [Scopulibacillus darangshiensis]TCP30244.1 transcriptional regulator [Scopulibacillus darangshiensis]
MLGSYIKELRIQKNLSLTELAERAGVSKSYLSTIERDLQKNPSIQFLEKIASVLDTTVESIVQSEPSMSKDQELPNLDNEWISIVKEAMESGIDKKDFKEFLDYQRWRRNKE